MIALPVGQVGHFPCGVLSVESFASSLRVHSHGAVFQNQQRCTGADRRDSSWRNCAIARQVVKGIAAPQRCAKPVSLGCCNHVAFCSVVPAATLPHQLSPQSTCDKYSHCNGTNARGPTAAATDPRSRNATPVQRPEATGSRAARNLNEKSQRADYRTTPHNEALAHPLKFSSPCALVASASPLAPTGGSTHASLHPRDARLHLRLRRLSRSVAAFRGRMSSRPIAITASATASPIDSGTIHSFSIGHFLNAGRAAG